MVSLPGMLMTVCTSINWALHVQGLDQPHQLCISTAGSGLWQSKQMRKVKRWTNSKPSKQHSRLPTSTFLQNLELSGPGLLPALPLPVWGWEIRKAHHINGVLKKARQWTHKITEYSELKGPTSPTLKWLANRGMEPTSHHLGVINTMLQPAGQISLNSCLINRGVSCGTFYL